MSIKQLLYVLVQFVSGTLVNTTNIKELSYFNSEDLAFKHMASHKTICQAQEN